MSRWAALQEGGEDEVEEAEPEVAVLPEAGMRKSARTENVDFKQREEERWVAGAAAGGGGLCVCTRERG